MSRKAVCVLAGRMDSPVTGTIYFSQKDEETTVKITGKISGLTPGKHGFHIHEYGDQTDGCATSGAIYNPEGKMHGGPSDINRKVGDLGNIIANEDGVADVNITDWKIRVTGLLSIIGRSVVVKAKEDDLGKIDNDESVKNGNAGASLACGVIGFTKE